MLPSSLSTARIIAKVSRTSVNLPGNESQHVFRRFLVDTHDPARMAKVCELNRKAEPIGGAPTLPDQCQVLGRKGVMAHDRRWVRRRVEQRRAGLRREDFVFLHVAQVSRNVTNQGLAFCLMLLPNGRRLATGKATAMLLGYARVSKSEDQETAPQIRALKQAGCKRIFEETASGGRWDRPELHRLLDQFRAGDTLVVWKLDRLSRSLKDLLVILERLKATGGKFRSLTESIDTSGPAGRMMMQMLGSFAEFLLGRLERRALRLQLAHDVLQVAYRAGQPVDAGDRQHVASVDEV